jgi:ketosteroid isomerase-like protein
MSDREEFLAWVDSRVTEAEIAIHDGNATPRRATWSREEPVSVFGAWKSAFGRPELDDLFSSLERIFGGCTSYRFDILAADVVGDMAYTVGYEHTQATVNGEPQTYTLRATQVYRREGGEWKVVHRHADTAPDEV